MSEELINHYKADERETCFLLFEQFGLRDLLGKEPFADFAEDDARLIVSEALKFAMGEIGPLNAYGDRMGCDFDPDSGAVTVAPLLKDLQAKFIESGWRLLRAPAEYGGQDAPESLALAVDEFFAGANSAWSMYNGLTLGAVHLIHTFGSEEQKALYCQKMFDGQWMGSMCLTEPGAGSEVGRSKTKAVKKPDGAYAITGNKCFISAGDHDFTENIIHMVLARIEGAPKGTKGLSLFIVPKMKVAPDGSVGESNDVITRGIEKKMGINASATAALSFGENGQCTGYLLGAEEQRGMRQMFQMMNQARIATGMQALALASSAYLNALDYARERVQGKLFEGIATGQRGDSVRIIEHEDVRRMLMEMRARVEGCRALALRLTIALDRARAGGLDSEVGKKEMGYVELLTPLVKAYLSDQSFRVAELAIQTHGGYGYIRDYPVEQYCRDIKIQSLYEGTNYIQALDLVGRKLNQDGGANVRNLLAEIGAFIEANKDHAAIGAEIGALKGALEALSATLMKYLEFSQSGQLRQIPLTATRLLEMIAEIAIAWLLLEGATIADEKMRALAQGDKEYNFYTGKVQTARFFIRNILPGVKMKAGIIAAGDASALEITENQFPPVRAD